MNAEASNVMLLDRQTHELVYEVALGAAGTAIKEQKRLKVGVGIAGWVAEHGKSLLVSDAYSDPRFFRGFDQKTGFKTKSLICIPLSARGDLIGVAQIINKRGDGVFDHEDQDLFEQFGTIASIALDNAILYRLNLKQERYKRDLEIAFEIQKSMLPTSIPESSQVRIEMRSVACRTVGGDVLDLSNSPLGGISAFIGDVSGKGVPAALFAARLCSEYNYERSASSTSAELFTRLNTVISRRSSRGMFVTAQYFELDEASRKASWVNAGHLPPAVVKATGLEFLHPTSHPPLGILEGEEYTAESIEFAPESCLVLMTDGVIDAKSAAGEAFGTERMKVALAAVPGYPIGNLMKELSAFTTGALAADDITLIGVHFGNFCSFESVGSTECLSQIRHFAEEQSSKAGFSQKWVSRIALAVTEAAANVMKHTYQMAENCRIKTTASFVQGEFRLILRDWGPRQNSATFKSRDLEEIRPGGLGIHYIKQVMDIVLFDHTLIEGNELYLMKRLENAN